MKGYVTFFLVLMVVGFFFATYNNEWSVNTFVSGETDKSVKGINYISNLFMNTAKKEGDVSNSTLPYKDLNGNKSTGNQDSKGSLFAVFNSTKIENAAIADAAKVTSTLNSVTKMEEEKLILLKKLSDIELKLAGSKQKIDDSVTNHLRKEGQIENRNDSSMFRKRKRRKKGPAPDSTDFPTKVPQRVVKSCPYDFKVYVYDLPDHIPSVRYGVEARKNKTLHVCQKCILEQFSLEYIVYDFFTQFCGRTYDPAAADFFYLPIIRDAEYRVKIDSNNKGKRQPSTTEQALLDILENGKTSKWIELFNITDKYWRAHDGGDHIIAMPAPVTNLRHETGKRGFFHYMSHLHTPIFLNVEYSLSFVKEYPICGNQKNIVMPYPTTDYDLFSGKLYADPIERTSLLYYAGGMHGDCVEVRRAMKFLMLNSSSIPGIVPHVKTIQAEREHGFRAATYCPIPIGDSPSSKRMYDVMNFGCIPVVLSDDLVWAYTRQTGGPLNHNTFSIQLPQCVVQYSAETLLRKYSAKKASFGRLPDGDLIYDILEKSHNGGGTWQNGIYVNSLVQILRNISPRNVEILRAGVAASAPKFRYFKMNSSMKSIPTASHTLPTGGAIDMLAVLLSQRKAVGLDKLRDHCQSERNRKDHLYVDKYPCDPNRRRLQQALNPDNIHQGCFPILNDWII
jgi:hypothetical protein